MAKETSLKSWGKLWGQILLPIPHFSLWWKFGDGIWPPAANSVPGLLGVYLSTQRNNSWHSDIPVHSFCSGGKKEISLLATRKSNRTEVLPVICLSRVSNNLYEVLSNAEWFSLIPTVPLVCDAFHRSHFSTTKQQRICWENPNTSTRLQNLSWQVQGVQSQLPALLVAPHQHQWGGLNTQKQLCQFSFYPTQRAAFICSWWGSHLFQLCHNRLRFLLLSRDGCGNVSVGIKMSTKNRTGEKKSTGFWILQPVLLHANWEQLRSVISQGHAALKLPFWPQNNKGFPIPAQMWEQRKHKCQV